MQFCPTCDSVYDTDFETDCPHCEEVVEVAPGIFQTKEDYDANMEYDEMKDIEHGNTLWK